MGGEEELCAVLCHLIKLASVVTRAEQTDKADTRQITLTAGRELESDTKEMKQAEDSCVYIAVLWHLE